MRLRRAATVAVAWTIAFAAGSCGSPASPAPSGADGSPVPSASASPIVLASPAWPSVSVPQPSAVDTVPSLEPGYQCHPCHFVAEDELLGVAPSPGGLIAVGYQTPPAEALAFSSADGRRWVATPGFSGATGTSAIAVASAGDRIVIVGSDASGAAAWLGAGDTWTPAPRQDDLLVPDAAGAMTSVIAAGDGFVAGGYHDDPTRAAASAAVWRSTDGLHWQADDGAGTFAGGRIWSLAVSGGTIVAVGTGGDPIYGPAAAWRWTPAGGWERAAIAPDPGGAMRAVTATATGFVAVGKDADDRGAMTWTSSDGRIWTAAPDQPSFHSFTDPVRMQAVIGGSGGLVAVGWRSDAAKGSGVVWTSTDGVTWLGPTWETGFSGGEMTGVAAIGSTTVAVGRTGYPDWNAAAIWASPAP